MFCSEADFAEKYSGRSSVGKNSLTILAIDDHPDNLTSLKAVVTDAFPHARFLNALNGAEGLELALAADPDVILFDIAMPGMDGFEVCRRLKADERTQHIPVVFLTTLETSRENRLKALDAGAEAFLPKPVEEVEMTAQIRAMAKIKAADVARRQERERLAAPVAEGVPELDRELAGRLETNALLRESELRFRSLFENSPVAYQSLDIEGRYIDVNQELSNLLGYPPEELLGRSFSELWLEEMCDLFPRMFEAFKIEGRMRSELQLIRKDGRQIGVIVEGRVQRDKDGAFMRTHCILTDFTVRKRVENALLESEARLDLALRSAHMGVWSWDIVEDKRYFDNHACLLLGIDPATFTGTEEEFFRVVHPDDRGILKTAMARTFAEDVMYEPEYRVVLPDGSIRCMTARGRVIRDESGKPRRISGIVWDVTERARAAGEKEKLESRLRQAQKMETLGGLAGGIAHDFNNILSPILGYAEMILSEIQKDTQLHYDIMEIRKAGLRAKDLVAQILTFSRKKEQERLPVRLSLVIKEVLQLLRASLPTTIEIRTNISSDANSGTAYADPTQIHQILMNLCTNSAHAMRDGTGTLGVGLENVEVDSESAARYSGVKPGSYLKLSVSDTGCGMSAEVLSRIFDPYFTTKAEGEGAGLGLAVVYGIVVSYGGTISAYSEPEKGAVFHVLLPRIQPADLPVPASFEPLPKGHGRILIVDDEKTVNDMESRMLRRLGYEVVSKSGSQEALDAFRSEPAHFDLVLSDQTMPKMTGAALARELIEIRPDIPIILCTGHSDAIDEDKAKAMGIRGFLMKPLSLESLAKTVRELLEHNDDRD